MKLPDKNRRQERPAFTLVEMLVVILIILILVGLLTIAVGRAIKSANRVKDRNEITQLDEAVQNFKAKFGVYPPSRIILCERYSDYINPSTNQPWTPLHQASLAFINRIFPRINWQSPNPPTNPVWLGIDWNGSGVNNAQGTPGPDSPVILEGDQCLVFFLGGIPSPPGPLAPGTVPTCSGFSTNPQNPAWHVLNGGDTIQPFYTFQTSRLIALTNRATLAFANGAPAAPVSPFHYSYLDTYGSTPFAFFSTGGLLNGYNPWASQVLVAGGGTPQQSSDCTTLGVWPYAEKVLPAGTLQYLNPNTFQIISAGDDMVFGRGTDLNWTQASGIPQPLWTIALAGNTGATSVSWDYSSPTPNVNAGVDDLANFYDSMLGAGTQ